MKFLLMFVLVLGMCGCSSAPKQDYDKCPKCGNPFIYGTVGYGSERGKKFVACYQCGWKP